MPERRYSVISIVRDNPNIVAGTLVFGCMFALIAGNAIFSQPGSHPGPIWNTRDALTTNSVASVATPRGKARNAPAFEVASAAARPQRTLPDTIYVDHAYLEHIGVPSKRPHSAPDAASAGIQLAATDVSAVSTASNGTANATTGSVTYSAKLLSQTQDRLKQLGLYSGAVDGLYGPATKRAIETFEINAGLEKSGVPSPSLLFSINRAIGLVTPDNSSGATGGASSASSASAATSPTAMAKDMVDNFATEAMPKSVLNQATKGTQPIEAASFTVPQAPVQKSIDEDLTQLAPLDTAEASDAALGAGSANADAADFSSQSYEQEMITLAQKGLAAFGVDGIAANGVLTPQTVDALIRFQERYQLTTSGRPDESTIRKMLEIGALRKG